MKLGYAIPYPISIEASANNGFVVKVGCAVLTASSKWELLDGLDKYLSEPDKWVKEYSKKCSGEVVAENRRPELIPEEQHDQGATGTIGRGPETTR